MLLACLWILTVFLWKISGSHFNPAISFAYMFRKDEKKISAKLCICYMLVQIIGGFLGGLLALWMNFNETELKFRESKMITCIIMELGGSFIYTFFFMMSTDDKLLFSQEKAINCFIIASSYVAARSIFFGDGAVNSTYGAVLNPAIALGIQLTTLLNNGLSAWQSIYIFPVVPFGGAALGVIFFELVFKKTQAFLAHEPEAISNEDDEEDH